MDDLMLLNEPDDNGCQTPRTDPISVFELAKFRETIWRLNRKPSLDTVAHLEPACGNWACCNPNHMTVVIDHYAIREVMQRVRTRRRADFAARTAEEA